MADLMREDVDMSSGTIWIRTRHSNSLCLTISICTCNTSQDERYLARRFRSGRDVPISLKVSGLKTAADESGKGRGTGSEGDRKEVCGSHDTQLIVT